MEKQTKIKIRSIDGYEIPAVFHHARTDLKNRTNVDLVVLAHGIFSNKDERGRFIRQANLHVNNGCEVIRFDFRGHGEHSIQSKDVTIGGMIIDFHSVLKYAKSITDGKIFVVASSFGAGILLLYLQTSRKICPDRMVFLNPVVDYRATMLQAVLQWGKNLFNEAGFKELEKTGYITLEGGFKMRAEMVMELDILRPYYTFKILEIPTRVIHGDKDSKVPYSVVKEESMVSKYVDFQTIFGADHAFKPDQHEKKSFDLILGWLYRS
jgi:pimeloyl-ACP methyl ester carboxylesterase